MLVARAIAFIVAFATLSVTAPALRMNVADAAEQLVVVELFTSQGCSSCPAADALLGELANRPDVLPLSAHVGYWDYLGWTDPFARNEAVERQRAYAKRFGLNYVYTPQIVVQGLSQVRGSDRESVIRLIADALQRTPMEVRFEQGSEGVPLVRLEPMPLDRVAEVWLVQFDRRHITDVNRGENGGRQMINYNVIRTMTRMGAWRGESTAVRLTPGLSAEAERAAIVVQEENAGRILGAALVGEPRR